MSVPKHPLVNTNCKQKPITVSELWDLICLSHKFDTAKLLD